MSPPHSQSLNFQIHSMWAFKKYFHCKCEPLWPSTYILSAKSTLKGSASGFPCEGVSLPNGRDDKSYRIRIRLDQNIKIKNLKRLPSFKGFDYCQRVWRCLPLVEQGHIQEWTPTLSPGVLACNIRITTWGWILSVRTLWTRNIYQLIIWLLIE